jgi:DNA-binding CsgD family transcriptional regulator
VVDVLDRRAFIGREREVARLLAMLDTIERDGGRTVVVAGEAGVGKSRLLARLIEVAGDRAQNAIGACLPVGSGALPFAPFVEVLRGIVRRTDPALLPALLGPGRGQLARLLPEIASRDADAVAAAFAGEADPTSKVRLFELVLGLVQRLARQRPLILGIEDVQWADRSSAELVAFLVRGLRDDPVLVVLTLRAEPASNLEEGSTPRELVAELERDEGVERIDLEPFGRAEVADQVAALLDDRPSPALVDALYERADGNPFFIEELVLSGAAEPDRDVPAVVRDVVAARLAGLTPRTRDVLRAATVGGRAIDEALLGEVLGLDARAIAAALREAVDAGVLERDPLVADRPAAFRHALLRETVEAELFPAERVELHRAFAEALESRGDRSRRPDPADLARHWDGAGVPERALGPMVSAARAAEAVYAWPEALELWQRARVLFASVVDADVMASMSLGELIGRGADTAVLAGDHAAAIQLGRAAIDAVDAEADPVLAGILRNRLRWYLWESGDRRGAAEAVAAALALIPADPPSQARASALAQHAGVLLFAGDYAASRTEAEAALAMARELESPSEIALALGVLGWGLAALGDVDAGLERFREGQAIAEAIGSAEGTAVAAINLVSLLDRIGRSSEELTAATESAALMDRLGLGRTYGSLLLGYAAKAQLVLGRWDDVEQTTAAALRNGAADRAELWLSINRARLLVGRGFLAGAAKLLERSRAIEGRLGGTEFAGSLLLAEAELAMWRGELGAVRACAAAGIELARDGPPDAALAWLAIVTIRAEADARDRMAARAEQADVPVAAQVEIEAAIRSVLATRPELQVGDRTDAIQAQLRAERARLAGTASPDLWSQVAAAWTELGRPYAAAYARFREAEATLASRGSREAASDALRRARVDAGSLGAAPLLGLIDGLARAGRVPLATPDVGVGEASGDADPYGFTPREREVLELVAGGRTNQQIAERLFITRKTASVHVSNVMAKLGAANRGEAAAMARRLGLC